LASDQRAQLAEHLSRAEHGLQILPTVWRGSGELDLAVDDREQLVALVAFFEDDVAAREVLVPHGHSQGHPGVVVERGKEGELAEHVLHVIHVRDSHM